MTCRCGHPAHADVCAVLVLSAADERVCGCLIPPHGVLRTTPLIRHELRRLGIDPSSVAGRVPEGCALALNADVRGWRASLFMGPTIVGQERGADLGHVVEYLLAGRGAT